MSEMETILSTRRDYAKADMRKIQTFFDASQPKNKNKEN
jgi:hypothetical protein